MKNKEIIINVYMYYQCFSYARIMGNIQWYNSRADSKKPRQIMVKRKVRLRDL